MVLVGPAVNRFPAEPVIENTLIVHGELDDTIPLSDVLDWARPQDLSVVVIPGAPPILRFDSTRAESRLARLVVTDALERAARRRPTPELREQPVTEVGSRYIDFLIPGLLGMNIMGTGMWGIGFAVVKSLILAKFMLVLEAVKLGARRRQAE